MCIRDRVKDILLFLGGLFLVGKSVYEIHDEIGPGGGHGQAGGTASFTSAIIQIAIMDIVFSLDSIFTAVGMADELWGDGCCYRDCSNSYAGFCRTG